MHLKLDGFGQLHRKLDRLEAKTGKKVVRRALRTGAKLIHAEAKALVPVDEGELKRTLKVRAAKTSRRSKSFGVAVITDASAFEVPDAAHHAAVEYGTADAAAQPYMRPAFDNKKAQALGVVTAEIKRGVLAEARAT